MGGDALKRRRGFVLLVQSRQPQQACGVLGAEFSHQSRPVAFECSVADLQSRPAFLVGAALSDETKDLTLACCQRHLASRELWRIRGLVARVSGLRPPSNDIAALCDCSVLLERRLECVANTLHQRANALRLVKRIFSDLLQGRSIAIRG